VYRVGFYILVTCMYTLSKILNYIFSAREKRPTCFRAGFWACGVVRDESGGMGLFYCFASWQVFDTRFQASDF
jgi:hypothetical protein